MQYPEITVPVIELDGKRFTLERDTDDLSHGLRAEIEVEGKTRGQVKAYYTEADRNFLNPEEQHLLKGVAEALGGWLARKQMEEALRERKAWRSPDWVGRGLSGFLLLVVASFVLIRAAVAQ